MGIDEVHSHDFVSCQSFSASCTWPANYLSIGGFQDGHGGGCIEEWTSVDSGRTWHRKRGRTPDQTKYPGWKFNNIQPVTSSDGSVVRDMLLFYGWKDKDAPEAKAFLLVENDK